MVWRFSSSAYMKVECCTGDHSRLGGQGLSSNTAGLNAPIAMTRRRCVRGVSLAVAAIIGIVLLAPGVAGGTARPISRRPISHRRSGRVLLLSVPGLSWADLQSADLPHLRRLLAGSANGALIARTARGFGQIADGYATLGAGTRSASDAITGGLGFEPSERFGTTTAGEAFALRTGRSVHSGLVQMDIANILAVNTSLLFGAKPGALGDALSAAGYRQAVIANADQVAPEAPFPGNRYQRAAVAALMQSNGTVAAGEVGGELLTPDPSAPYGTKLDPLAYERAFTRVWRPGSVVLGEASDLVRAGAYKSFVTAAQWPAVRHQALQSTDLLIGRLLAHVDLHHDAVVTIAPSRPGGGGLAIAAVSAPGYAPGFLRSATTRRTKYVALVDVAPTILAILGLPVPTSMEGRAMEPVATGGTLGVRIKALEVASDDSLFRDSLIGEVTIVFVVATLALALAALVLRAARPALVRRLLGWCALVLLGFLVSVFASVPLHFRQNGGRTAFWCFAVGLSVLLAVIYKQFGRRSPLDALILALGAIVVLHVADALTGARLELDSPWGYSPTVGIRLAGLGNLSFAHLAASAALLAGLLTWRIPGRAGARSGAMVLLVTFLSLTPPLWGQNFGGTLATAPAFAAEGWLLLGRRLRWRNIFVLGAILVAAGLSVGLLDMMRPLDQQTHVGRFFQQVSNQGISGLAMVLHRKGSENVSTLNDQTWVLFLLAVAVLSTWYWLRTDGPRRLFSAVPPLRYSFVGLGVLVVLGYLLKDSGIAVPGMMVSVAVISIVYVDAARNEGESPGAGRDADGSGRGLDKQSAVR